MDATCPNVADLENVCQSLDNVLFLLSTLPHKLKHKVTVPFGSRAFFKGELIHTNELLVHLGCSTLVECTASQAHGIIERRRQAIVFRLEKAREASNKISLCHLALQQPASSADDEPFVEVRETLEEYALLKQLANSAAPEKRTTTDFNDERLFKRLEELEALEEAGQQDEGTVELTAVSAPKLVAPSCTCATVDDNILPHGQELPEGSSLLPKPAELCSNEVTSTSTIKGKHVAASTSSQHAHQGARSQSLKRDDEAFTGRVVERDAEPVPTLPQFQARSKQLSKFKQARQVARAASNT